MIGRLAWIGGLGLLLVASGARAQVPADPFPDAHEAPPSGWTGPVFKLSQDYPTTKPGAEPRPWKTIDFKTDPNGYLLALRNYCYEGNIAVDWRGQDNAVRKWYHVPWMHHDLNKGREFIHGMTKERSTQAGRLHPSQTSPFPAIAVGMYNPLGGYIIGRVWKDHHDPDPGEAVFPEGTVACKLLFTQATVAQVPYLTGAFEWQANTGASFSDTSRTRRTVRLLQIDVAVKDSRASATTGWVFGTFNYDGNAPGATPWEKMLPVGLMWGNDPTLTPAQYRAGKRPTQTKIITSNLRTNTTTAWKGLGWLERLDGPIDNPVSACLSCHMTAEWTSTGVRPVGFVSTLTPAQVNSTNPLDSDVVANKMKWFKNIKRKAFTTDGISLDYSLQLADSIEFWFQAEGHTR